MSSDLLSSEKTADEESVISNENERTQLSHEEALQLQEQIRKFVQLLTQSYLLSRGRSELTFINESSKQILMELRNIASENNLFNAYNLDGALAIIEDFKFLIWRKAKVPKAIPSVTLGIMSNSAVFMYPELLPICSFRPHVGAHKIFFTKAEDNLIALGLERFSKESAPLHQIQIHLLPCKKASQIHFRIKNLKASKNYNDNPIKYYYTHKKAPSISRNVQIFDPNKVKAPKDYYPLTDLPEVFASFISKMKCKSQQISAVQMQPIVPKHCSQLYFILPNGIQADNSLQSLTLNPFYVIHSTNNDIKTKHRKYKPPFILPKSVRRNDLEDERNDDESKQDYTAKNINKPFDVSDDKSVECNNNSDAIKTQSIKDNKDNRYNNTKVVEKKVQERTKAEHLVVNNIKYTDNSFAKDVTNEKPQNVVNSLVIKEKKIIETNNTKDVAKESDAQVVIHNNCNENIKSKYKKTSVLDKVIIRSLPMVDGKNNDSKKFDINESIVALRKKYIQHKDDPTCLYENSTNIPEISCESSKSVNTPACTEKDCDIIIKSEIVEQIADSSQEACLSDYEAATTNPILFLYLNNNNTYNSNLSEAKTKNKTTTNAEGPSSITWSANKHSPDCVVDPKNLHKNNMLHWENNVVTKGTKLSINSFEKVGDIVIKSEVVEEISDPSQNEYLSDCETAAISNSSISNGYIPKQNSNFLESEVENKNIKFDASFPEITMTSLQYGCSIKQEINDEFEIGETCKSLNFMNPNKSDIFIEPMINSKNNVDVKSTLNSKQVIDQLPHSSDKEYGLVIKSEFIEPNNDIVENACKSDLIIDSNSANKTNNVSLRKRNLRSVNQFSPTERKKTFCENIDTAVEFPKFVQSSNVPSHVKKNKIVNNNGISKKGFTRNGIRDITIKSENIQDGETFVQNISDFNKRVLRSMKKVIKSNSLEKAHLKRCSRIITQKKRKLNYKTKRKVRKIVKL